LSGASLKGANLMGARLPCADLSDADLSGALFGSTDFSGADLRGAIGVDQQMLSAACGDAATKLPDGLSIKPCAQRDSGVTALRAMERVLSLRDSPNPCWQNMLHDTWPLTRESGMVSCPAQAQRAPN